MNEAQKYFVTGVSMITSRGSKGNNVMAAEWTMQISHDPMLIAVFIHKGSVTLNNIIKTKEFGVNVASDEQSTAISTAGGFSRTEIDKLSISDIFKIIKPKKIKTPLIQNCVLTAECKLVTTKTIGDHTMLVGKVVQIQHDETKRPLIYHKNRYFQTGSAVEPDRKQILVNLKIFNMFNKKPKKFILKYIGAIIKSKHGILVVKNNKESTIPLIESPTRSDYRKHLEKYLQKNKLDVQINDKPILRRVILKNKQQIQRVNFVLFTGSAKTSSDNFIWNKKDEFTESLL